MSNHHRLWNLPLPDYSDVMGGFWGNHIQWSDYDRLRIWGHKPWDQRLKEGDTILSEHQQSYMWFVVKKVEYCSNPHDMFFADVEFVHREVKPYNPEAFRFAAAREVKP